MNIHLEHDILLGVDAFWTAFFDKGFNERLYKDHLRFPEFEISEQVETEKEIRRKLRVLPRLDMPGAVQKVLGSSFRYAEEGTFDKATKVWKFRTIPSMMADKTRNEGTLRVERVSDDKVRRILDVVLEVKVFGLGGTLESTFEKAIRDGWNNSASYMNDQAAKLAGK